MCLHSGLLLTTPQWKKRNRMLQVLKKNCLFFSWRLIIIKIQIVKHNKGEEKITFLLKFDQIFYFLNHDADVSSIPLLVLFSCRLSFNTNGSWNLMQEIPLYKAILVTFLVDEILCFYSYSSDCAPQNCGNGLNMGYIPSGFQAGKSHIVARQCSISPAETRTLSSGSLMMIISSRIYYMQIIPFRYLTVCFIMMVIDAQLLDIILAFRELH